MKATNNKMPATPDQSVATVNGAGNREADCRLDSWKEIASYLGRSVRCAQRWERQLGLPVHRIRLIEGCTVYAYASELETWRQSRDQVETQVDGDRTPKAPTDQTGRSDNSSLSRWGSPVFGLYKLFLKTVPVRIVRS